VSKTIKKEVPSRRKFMWQLGAFSLGMLRPVRAAAQVPFAFFKSVAATTTPTWSPGKLFSWGSSNYGDLGLGALGSQSSPVQVGSSTTWTKVVSTTSHTLALNSGKLFSWGSNSSGELGIGTTVGKSSPVQVGAATDWGDVAAGGESSTYTNTSFAVKTSGTLWAWGSNNFGQFGDVTIANNSSPIQIGTGTTWSQVVGSAANSYGMSVGAMQTDRSLWMWGDNTYGQLGIVGPALLALSGFASVSVSMGFSAGIRTDGTLWTWGDNATGNLGDGTTTSRTIPKKVGTGTTWRTISTSGQTSNSQQSFMVATKTDNTLWGWGDNAFAELGTGNYVSRSSPVQIGIAEWKTASAGGDLFNTHYVQALKTDNTRWTWGRDANGELGIAPNALRSVGASAWTKISAGTSHAVGIRTDGTLWGWGANDVGQLGSASILSGPTQLITGTWSEVCAGDTWTLAVRSDGTLWATGSNSDGQLGTGSTTSLNVFTQIGTLTNWKYLTSGCRTTNAVKTDGTVDGYGWKWAARAWSDAQLLFARSSWRAH
jgi:alpha-tubulin suppressor-like RCC1 family protein